MRLGVSFLLFFVLCGVYAAPSIPQTCQWQWNYYFVHGMPEGLFKDGKKLSGTLTLPDKRVVKAVSFKLPESGTIDLNNVIEPRPKVLERVIVTSDFYAEKAQRLVLGLGVDWKCRLYLNGKVIFDSVRSGNEEVPITHSNYLVELNCQAGNNQLIWEVFGGLSSFTLSALLKDIPPLAMRYQPWTVFPDAADNGINVVFAASRPTPAAVEYRLAGSKEWIRVYNSLSGVIRRDKAVHSIRLADLEPGKTYEYRIVLFDETNMMREVVQRNIHTFKTAVAAQKTSDFTFNLISDLQITSSERAEFLNSVFKIPGNQASSFTAFVGDVHWASNFDLTIIEEFINLYRTASDNKVPLVMVRGNHEIYGRDCAKYFDYFVSPRTKDKSYFMFTYGDVCFIVLDFLDNSGRSKFPSTCWQFDPKPFFKEQTRWLNEAVKTPEFQRAKYRVVLSHAPLIGNCWPYLAGNIRSTVEPLFSGKDPKYRIHLWLSGHTHRPLRSIPLKNEARSVMPIDYSPTRQHPHDGVKYPFPVVVMGGPNRKMDKVFHLTSLQVKVTSDALEVKHFDRSGKLFDHIKIAPDGKVSEIYADDERFTRKSY